jgi:hypothetical protein
VLDHRLLPDVIDGKINDVAVTLRLDLNPAARGPSQSWPDPKVRQGVTIRLASQNVKVSVGMH